MFKSVSRRVAYVLIPVLLTGPIARALASDTTSPSSTSSSTATSSPTPTGITGTDPEPIDPDIMAVILSLLSLA